MCRVLQNADRNKKINAVVSQTGRVVSQTGKAVGMHKISFLPCYYLAVETAGRVLYFGRDMWNRFII